MTAIDTALFVRVGRRNYPVSSFEDASAKFCEVRDRSGAGASTMPQCTIVDSNGTEIARISYNGRVWPPCEWTDDLVPLYDNCAKARTKPRFIPSQSSAR